MKFWVVRLVSLAVAFGVAFGADAWIAGSMPSAYRLAVLAGLFVTLAVSLNLINGITGQFSIGHAAFYMVGAYTTGFVSNQFYAQQPLGQPMWLIAMALLGAAAAAVAGLVVGLPSLRLRGDYLAIVTLGFGEILRIVTQNISQIGGFLREKGKPVGGPVQNLWGVVVLALFFVFTSRDVLKKAHGLPFVAVRDDEVASSAMGVRVSSVKVTAFVIGSAFAGAAGAMLSHAETFISPDMFRMDVSFIILTMVVLGGTGSITGSVVAAVFSFRKPAYFRTRPNPPTTPSPSRRRPSLLATNPRVLKNSPRPDHQASSCSARTGPLGLACRGRSDGLGPPRSLTQGSWKRTKQGRGVWRDTARRSRRRVALFCGLWSHPPDRGPQV